MPVTTNPTLPNLLPDKPLGKPAQPAMEKSKTIPSKPNFKLKLIGNIIRRRWKMSLNLWLERDKQSSLIFWNSQQNAKESLYRCRNTSMILLSKLLELNILDCSYSLFPEYFRIRSLRAVCNSKPSHHCWVLNIQILYIKQQARVRRGEANNSKSRCPALLAGQRFLLSDS